MSILRQTTVSHLCKTELPIDDAELVFHLRPYRKGTMAGEMGWDPWRMEGNPAQAELRMPWDRSCTATVVAQLVAQKSHKVYFPRLPENRNSGVF